MHDCLSCSHPGTQQPAPAAANTHLCVVGPLQLLHHGRALRQQCLGLLPAALHQHGQVGQREASGQAGFGDLAHVGGHGTQQLLQRAAELVVELRDDEGARGCSGRHR
jgi:hypothetical protein